MLTTALTGPLFCFIYLLPNDLNLGCHVAENLVGVFVGVALTHSIDYRPSSLLLLDRALGYHVTCHNVI